MGNPNAAPGTPGDKNDDFGNITFTGERQVVVPPGETSPVSTAAKTSTACSLGTGGSAASEVNIRRPAPPFSGFSGSIPGTRIPEMRQAQGARALSILPSDKTPDPEGQKGTGLVVNVAALITTLHTRKINLSSPEIVTTASAKITTAVAPLASADTNLPQLVTEVLSAISTYSEDIPTDAPAFLSWLDQFLIEFIEGKKRKDNTDTAIISIEGSLQVGVPLRNKFPNIEDGVLVEFIKYVMDLVKNLTTKNFQWILLDKNNIATFIEQLNLTKPPSFDVLKTAFEEILYKFLDNYFNDQQITFLVDQGYAATSQVPTNIKEQKTLVVRSLFYLATTGNLTQSSSNRPPMASGMQSVREVVGVMPLALRPTEALQPPSRQHFIDDDTDDGSQSPQDVIAAVTFQAPDSDDARTVTSEAHPKVIAPRTTAARTMIGDLALPTTSGARPVVHPPAPSQDRHTPAPGTPSSSRTNTPDTSRSATAPKAQPPAAPVSPRPVPTTPTAFDRSTYAIAAAEARLGFLGSSVLGATPAQLQELQKARGHRDFTPDVIDPDTIKADVAAAYRSMEMRRELWDPRLVDPMLEELVEDNFFVHTERRDEVRRDPAQPNYDIVNGALTDTTRGRAMIAALKETRPPNFSSSEQAKFEAIKKADLATAVGYFSVYTAIHFKTQLPNPLPALTEEDSTLVGQQIPKIISNIEFENHQTNERQPRKSKLSPEQLANKSRQDIAIALHNLRISLFASNTIKLRAMLAGAGINTNNKLAMYTFFTDNCRLTQEHTAKLVEQFTPSLGYNEQSVEAANQKLKTTGSKPAQVIQSASTTTAVPFSIDPFKPSSFETYTKADAEKKAKEEKGWFGRAKDTVSGWFGSKKGK